MFWRHDYSSVRAALAKRAADLQSVYVIRISEAANYLLLIFFWIIFEITSFDSGPCSVTENSNRPNAASAAVGYNIKMEIQKKMGNIERRWRFRDFFRKSQHAAPSKRLPLKFGADNLLTQNHHFQLYSWFHSRTTPPRTAHFAQNCTPKSPSAVYSDKQFLDKSVRVKIRRSRRISANDAAVPINRRRRRVMRWPRTTSL